MIAALVLAYNPNDVKPGWIALVLVVSLGVATFLLWRSMNAQLRKIQMAPRVRQRPGAPQPRPTERPEASAAPGRADRPSDDGPPTDGT